MLQLWLICHQGGTRSHVSLLEADLIPALSKRHFSGLSTVHLPRVKNWQGDFLQRLDVVKWSLHPKVFWNICYHWGMQDVALMESCFQQQGGKGHSQDQGFKGLHNRHADPVRSVPANIHIPSGFFLCCFVGSRRSDPGYFGGTYP